MSMRTSAKFGFTLLELLVVVAVIGLLMAMLLPVLSAVAEAGRAAVCGTNLNQFTARSPTPTSTTSAFRGTAGFVPTATSGGSRRWPAAWTRLNRTCTGV